MIKKDALGQLDKTANKIRKRLADALDVNYAVSEIQIGSVEEFNLRLFSPFRSGAPIYYRGEKINSRSRRLVPTFLRNEEILAEHEGKRIIGINAQTVFDYYNKNTAFMSVYKTIYDEPSLENMYDMTAFAQHYLDVSPFIDFTKSLFVAVSFAVKDRESVTDDMVIYTAFDIDFDDTTSDVREVNGWLKNYNVQIIDAELPEATEELRLKIAPLPPVDLKAEARRAVNGLSPSAKLIDIPTNDLMKYQQGVFLLLNDFSLVNSNYLTKTVRQSFVINKYIIDKSLCAPLREFILKNAPQYRYECLMNISKAVKG